MIANMKKMSQNLKSKHTVCLSFYDNAPFIFKCFQGQQDSKWHKKAGESTEPESCQTAKIVFLLLLSSDGLVQNCETLS